MTAAPVASVAATPVGETVTLYKVQPLNWLEPEAHAPYAIMQVVLRRTPKGWKYDGGDRGIIDHRLLFTVEDIRQNFLKLSLTPEAAVTTWEQQLIWAVGRAQRELTSAEEQLAKYQLAMQTKGAIRGRPDKDQDKPGA